MYEIKRDIHTRSHAILVIISWKIYPPMLITIWHAYESWICCCFKFIYTYSISLVSLRYGDLMLHNTELSFKSQSVWSECFGILDIIYARRLQFLNISYLLSQFAINIKVTFFCFSSKIWRSKSVPTSKISVIKVMFAFIFQHCVKCSKDNQLTFHPGSQYGDRECVSLWGARLLTVIKD